MSRILLIVPPLNIKWAHHKISCCLPSHKNFWDQFLRSDCIRE